MDFEFVVGGEDCSISEVLKTLYSLPSFQPVRNYWSELAYRLETPSDSVKKLKQDFILDKIGLYDCLYSILELWVGRVGNDATIEKLVAGLEEMGLKDCKDPLSSIPINKYLSKTSFTWSEVTPQVQEYIVLRASHLTGFELNLGNHRQVFSTLDHSLLKQLINGEKVKLFKESLPKDISYYVPRRVASRNIISNDIFGSKSGNDIFLFLNLDMPELYLMAEKETTGYSRDNLDYPKSRFMILNDSAHFDMICKRTDRNVHLIEKKSNLLIWRKSKGKINVLQECQTGKEEKFADDIFKAIRDLPVIISDTAGMGKSTLLVKIGNLIRQSNSTILVAFVLFADFVRQVKKYSFTSDIDLKKTIEVALGSSLCVNNLGQECLKSKLNESEKNIELLLDGFDEIHPNDITLAFEILYTISSFKSIRIWVTSRPHFLHKLEETLNVLGFNILPFDREEQIQFFVRFWSRSKPIEEVKLRSFSEACLDTLSLRLSDKDKKITGIPLQCLMVGEVFEEYLGFENAEATLKSSIRTITDLYQRFIESKFKKFENIYGLSDNQRRLLLDAHAKLSFELILKNPRDVKLLFGEASAAPQDILNIGIVENWSSKDQSPKFIHQTFAEYLTAWFLVTKITSAGDYEAFRFQDLIIYIFLEVLHTFNEFGIHDRHIAYQEFSHPVVCHFINTILIGANLKDSPLVTLNNASRKVLSSRKISVKRICYAALKDNYWGIFIFLDKLNAFDEIEKEIFTESFLENSIQYGDVPIFEIALRHFENNYSFSEQIKVDVLERALIKGNFLIVQFLLKAKGLDDLVKLLNRPLLQIVVQMTEDSSLAIIRQRKDIINVLYQLNHNLLEIKDKEGKTALVSTSVHIELLLELVRIGANILAHDNACDTVLNNVVKRLGADLNSHQLHNFLECLNIINKPGLRTLLQIRGWRQEKPFFSILSIYNWDPLKRTTEIVVKAGVNLNELNSLGYSCLAVAIDYDLSVETFRSFVEYGADVNWKHHETSQTLVHWASFKCNWRLLIQLLDNYKLGVNDLDSRQNSPLDLVAHVIQFWTYDRPKATKCAVELIRRGGRGRRESLTSILHHAIAFGYEQFVRHLIIKKKINIKKNWWTSLKILWKEKIMEKPHLIWINEGDYLIRMFPNLANAKMDMEAEGIGKETLLHVLMGKYPEWDPELFHSFVKMLELRNMSHVLKKRDEIGRTPLDVAMKRRNLSLKH